MFPGGAQCRKPGWRRLYLYSPEPGRRGLLQGRAVCAFRWVSILERRDRQYPALHQHSVLCLFWVHPTLPLSALVSFLSSQHGGHLSPPQLRQPWRSRESERMRSTEEEGLATTTTSTKRSAGVVWGEEELAGFKEQEGLLGLRAREVRGSAL